MTSETIDRERYPYRMRDLCELTGLDRQTVHFYIQQGLVPEGCKTGRNMAYYGPEHVERIRLVRQLQHERFLPLKAIRAMLEGRDDTFTPEQRALLADVRPRLAAVLGQGEDERETVAVAELLVAHGVSRKELAAMESLGLLTTVQAGGELRIAAQDAWMIELWGSLRAAGLSRELGFEVEDLGIYEEAISGLLEQEVGLLTPRLAHLPADEVAAIVQRALPLITTFITRYHLTKVRNFFSSLG
ncbi:MAG: MerR family transcriptional regulator [Myxococcales bacterium]|nr:MerR family transcriptional regulator [Myxococcales bacterium]MCB9700865.1 MerR family transcriptional regulator [Myxococcales bacterium]